MLVRVGGGGLTDPRTLFVRGAAAGHTLGVAGAVTGDDLFELLPVGFTEVVLALVLVPDEFGVGQRDPELVGLGHGHVDELPAQGVVGVDLDAPLQRPLGVGGIG